MRWLDDITDLMDINFEQDPGVGDGQGSLACCNPWGHKESDTTERLNLTELKLNNKRNTFDQVKRKQKRMRDKMNMEQIENNIPRF